MGFLLIYQLKLMKNNINHSPFKTAKNEAYSFLTEVDLRKTLDHKVN